MSSMSLSRSVSKHFFFREKMFTFISRRIIPQRGCLGQIKGALLKSAASIDILKAVKRIAEGGQVVSDEVRELLAKAPPVPELTERQRQILKSITEGLTNYAIATRLGISEDGVKRHVNAIFLKLGVESRAEAVAIALRKHLVKI